MAISAAAPRAVTRGRSFADPWLWTGCALYAAIFFALGSVRYAAHRNFVDLGIFSQTAVSAFGCFCNSLEGSHWAFHFSPILYAAGAVMYFWRSPLALIALQAIAGALVAPAVYGLVFRYTDRTVARLAAAVVFLYPPLAGLVFGDFHENGFAPAAIAWLLWAFDGGYTLAIVALAALALAIKEDQAVFLSIAGALGFLRYRGNWPRGPAALGIAIASAALALDYFLVIQPHAAANPHWAPERFYAWSAADVRALFPLGILERLGFLALAFVPLLLLPLRSRAIFIAIVPLAEVLFSRMPTTFTMGTHYAGAWVGYVFYAFTCALRRPYAHNPARVRTMLYWCVALCVVEFAVANPLHPGNLLPRPAARDVALDRFLQTLPAQLDVATQEEAYTHLAATHPNVTLLPESSQGTIGSCWVLIDRDYSDSPRLVESNALVNRWISQGRLVVDSRQGAITLYTQCL